MNKVYLSKSRYCKSVQCEKILWLNKYKPMCATEMNNEFIFATGRKVGEIAKSLFGDDYKDVKYDRKLQRMIEKTKEFLQEKPNVITEASFTYDNNFCSVDILKNDTDGVEIYEVKSSTEVKDIYLDDASYQYYVLSNLGLNVKKVAIVYINREYTLEKELDIHQLFNIGDITDIAIEKQDEIKNNIVLINKYMQEHGKFNEPIKNIGMHCSEPYDCEFWEYCTRDLPKPNVFDIAGMWKSKKFEKYNEGKISFNDLENEDLNSLYLEQIDFELHDKKTKIEKEAIVEIMDSLEYPLYFVDYETCQFAIPEIENTRPYQQIPFQYSLHILHDENSEIEHKEFLAKVDDKDIIRSFAESLINDINGDGSVIVYNKAFEATRNMEIAKMYPDLKDELERINSNMVDFLVPFRKRNIYKKEMQGSYSIKYVLPALYPDNPDLDYSNLSLVHNGGEASETFVSLKDKTPVEQIKIREALLKYCELDTYALVKIYDKFKEMID